MTHFVLISQARSGGTLVGSSLAEDHPDIIYFGELFHKNENIRIKEANQQCVSSHPVNGKHTFFHFDGTKSCDDYIDLFCETFKDKTAGFKLHYDHAPTWQTIPHKTNIKVIHLKRRDLLLSYVSLQKAIQSNEWHPNSVVHNVQPFNICPESCKKHMDQTVEFYKEFEHSFSNHCVLNIFYEDLCVDFQKTMNDICEFLCVKKITFKEHLIKPKSTNLLMQINNYNKLSQHMMQTQHSKYFAKIFL